MQLQSANLFLLPRYMGISDTAPEFLGRGDKSRDAGTAELSRGQR